MGSPIDHSMDDDTIYIDLLFMYVYLLLFCACACACDCACLRTRRHRHLTDIHQHLAGGKHCCARTLLKVHPNRTTDVVQTIASTLGITPVECTHQLQQLLTVVHQQHARPGPPSGAPVTGQGAAAAGAGAGAGVGAGAGAGAGAGTSTATGSATLQAAAGMSNSSPAKRREAPGQHHGAKPTPAEALKSAQDSWRESALQSGLKRNGNSGGSSSSSQGGSGSTTNSNSKHSSSKRTRGGKKGRKKGRKRR